MDGIVVSAIRRAIDERMGERGGDRPGPSAVRRSDPGAPADFVLVFDDAVLNPMAADPQEAELARAMVAGAPWIDTVVQADRRIYIEPSLDFMRGAVRSWLERGAPLHRNADTAGREAPVLVMTCCPNANKPLHLGHLRNCFICMAIGGLFRANGHQVFLVDEHSDYGIHICQAIVAYLRWGDGATPESTSTKPDHFVGNYYAMFHKAVENAPDAAQAQELRDAAEELFASMERGDARSLELNRQITGWAIEGIRRVYRRIGLRHDLTLNEIDVLPLAREYVEQARQYEDCLLHEDGAVLLDLTDEGLGEIPLLHADGTPAPVPEMTALMLSLVGLWLRRDQLFPSSRHVRPTGQEWDFGFAQILGAFRKLKLTKLADMTEPICHGMVELSDGEIHSRRGPQQTADAILDSLRQHFVGGWKDAGREATTYRVDICDRLAVGLLQLHILGVRRIDTLTYDYEQMLAGTLPRYASVLSALSFAAERGRTSRGEASAARPDRPGTEPLVRQILLQLDALPPLLEQALEERDPSLLVSYLCTLADRANAAAEQDVRDGDVWLAVETAMRSVLSTLSIDVPASLRDLPPLERVAASVLAEA